MATTLRINEQEQEVIRKKAIELNKKLIEVGQSPLKDSELVHKILIKAIKNSDLDEENRVTIKM